VCKLHGFLLAFMIEGLNRLFVYNVASNAELAFDIELEDPDDIRIQHEYIFIVKGNKIYTYFDLINRDGGGAETFETKPTTLNTSAEQISFDTDLSKDFKNTSAASNSVYPLQ